jgi:hypothetical protein
MTLANFNKQYEDILHSDLSSHNKAMKLGALMSDMEQVYKIPAMKSKEWENENRSVIALYRKISMSRDI